MQISCFRRIAVHKNLFLDLGKKNFPSPLTYFPLLLRPKGLINYCLIGPLPLLFPLGHPVRINDREGNLSHYYKRRKRDRKIRSHASSILRCTKGGWTQQHHKLRSSLPFPQPEKIPPEFGVHLPPIPMDSPTGKKREKEEEKPDGGSHTGSEKRWAKGGDDQIGD